ncbi:MAG TPA: EF-hand domain-containing protein [Candidatus Didemnitutus sp.]|nr:EF-hand domain-containing protein [Candidatus Didemnitutus sp.]
MKTRYQLVLASAALIATGAFAASSPPPPDLSPPYETTRWYGPWLQGWADSARDKEIRDALRPSAFDRNHDGKLDAEEFAAWDARVRSFVSKEPELMKRFDSNHDGVLDDAEWDTAFQKIFEAKRPVPAGTRK